MISLKHISILISSFFLLGLASCVTTVIELPKLTKEVEQLANLNNKQISVKINANEPALVGSQYLFILFPLGQIKLKNLRGDLANASTEKLALLGFKSSIVDSNTSPKLELLLDEIKINAFDLVFTRKISIYTSIKARFYNQYGVFINEQMLTNKTKAYKSFAFSKQLNFYYQKSLRQALDKLTIPLALYARSK